MILRFFVLRFFKYLLRRRFVLCYKLFFFEKNSFLEIKALKMKDFEKDLIKFFKKIIEIDFSFSGFD